jgi:hypothetical protein
LAGTGLLKVSPERVFIEGLKLFPHIRLYANAYVPSSSTTAGALIYCLYSVNDLTVPYMTAYVDLEDPFLNHVTDGLIVYVTPQFADVHAYTPLGIMTTNTSQSSNHSPYPTPRRLNAKPLVSSRGSGSNLTGRPFPLAFKVRFR